MNDTREVMELCDFYIEEHLGEKISRDALAELTHYSSSRFSRIFPLYHEGMNFREYLCKVRAERAAFLVTQGWRVESVAKVTGFGSYASMLRGFQKTFGKSIREYRNEYAAKTRGSAEWEAGRIMTCGPLQCVGYRISGLKADGLYDTVNPWKNVDFTGLPPFPPNVRTDREVSFWIGKPGAEESDYFFGFADEDVPCAEGFSSFMLPESKYAFFTVTNDASINTARTTGRRTMALWDYISREWFSSEEGAAWRMRQDIQFVVVYEGMNVKLLVPVEENIR